MTETITQHKAAQTAFDHAKQSLLAEHPSLAETIDVLDHAWITIERGTIEAALPSAEEAVQQLKRAREALTDARAKVETLGEQRSSDAELLGDQRASEEIAALLQDIRATTETYELRAMAFDREREELARQATEYVATIASLLERASQARQRAEQLDAQARKADAEAKQLYEQLRAQWEPLLTDRAIYESAQQDIEEVRPNADKIAELDQARGRHQSVHAELARIAADEEQIPVDDRLPIDAAQQVEATANQTCSDANNRRLAAERALKAFHDRRQECETYRRQMEEVDQEYRTFTELAELLKPGGRIQKAIAEQEQRKIAREANDILELLNDPLRIRIDQARRGKHTQDVTIVDTSDIAGGGASEAAHVRRYFEFLSGGEQFRVALALALALHRRVAGGTAGTLIVDEGFGALDGDRRDQLAIQMTNTVGGILGLGLAHSLIICSHAAEVKRHFRDSCWIIEKHAGTASARLADADDIS